MSVVLLAVVVVLNADDTMCDGIGRVGVTNDDAVADDRVLPAAGFRRWGWAGRTYKGMLNGTIRRKLCVRVGYSVGYTRGEAMRNGV